VHHDVVHDGHVWMTYPGGEPCLDQGVRLWLVAQLDGDVAVQQFLASSPHPCGRTPAGRLGQLVKTGQRIRCRSGGPRPAVIATAGMDRQIPAADGDGGAAVTIAGSLRPF
jgi:hypothetical protein